MKNCIKYFTYIMALFFVVLVPNVSAEDFEYDISPNQAIPLNFDQFHGISCTAQNFVFLEASTMNYSYDTIEPTEDGQDPTQIQKEAKMTVTYVSNAFPEEEARVETLACTFTKDVEKGTENGSFNVNFTIRPLATDVDNMTLIYGYDNKFNIFNPMFENEYMIENLKSVTKLTPHDTPANSYMDVNCPDGTTSDCWFEPNSSYDPDAGDAMAYYDIQYVDTFDNPHTATFYIKIIPNKYIYADFMSFSTCSFGGDWSNTQYNTRMRADLKVGNSISLPTCTIRSGENPLFKFHGWIDLSQKDANGNLYETQRDSKQMDTCASYPTVSNPVMTQESKNYYACYVSRRGVALHPDGGTLSSTSGAEEIDGVYYYPVEGTFTLPNVTTVPSAYDLYADAKFHGWKDANGNICNPAETTCTVPADGSHYFAVYSNNGVTINDAQTVIVAVEESQPIILPVDVEGCTENSDEISVNISGGQCFVFGHFSTNDAYVDVTVTAEGKTYIFKTKVIEREGNFENWQDDIVIDLTGNADYGISSGGTQVTTSNGVTLCEEYVVSNAGPSKKVGPVATYKGFGITFSQYRAKGRCDAGDVHLALCMDPGRPGPGSAIYVVDQSFDPTSDYGRVLTHIVKEFVRSGVDKDSEDVTAKDTIGAANAAVRLAEYFWVEELANTSDNKTTPYFRNAIAAYTAAGSALREACPTGLADCSTPSVVAALSNAWVWSNTFVLNTAAGFMSNYQNTEAIADINDVKNEATQAPAVFNSNSVVFNFTGTLKDFGPDVDLNSLKYEKDCKAICSDSSCCSFNYTISGNVVNYTFSVTLDDNNVQKLSTFRGDKAPAIIVSADETGYKAANVFVLKPKNGNHQRMATFNLEGTKMRFELTLVPRCELSFHKLNPASPSFNPVFFREMGCCETIKNRTEELYVNTYKYYCSQFCYTSNFTMYCNPTKVGGTDEIDSYSIKEGKIGATGAKSYYCVVDVTANTAIGKIETNKKVDYSGNKYANGAAGIANNPYCAVACREEWDLSLPGFDNFLGANAINAGGFFSIDKYLYFNTKRTCYSSFIDYEAYVVAQQNLSETAVKAYSLHSEYTQVYSILDASRSTATKNYKKWYYNSSEDYKCHSNDGCARRESYSCPTKTNPNRTCRRCVEWIPCSHTCHRWRYTEHTCTVYTISTNTTRSFDHNKYIQTDNTGDGLNIEQAYVYNSSPSTSMGRLGSSSGRTKVESGSNLVYSYHKVGSKPPASTHSTSSTYEGSCCGTSLYNCSYGTVGYSQLLDDVNYKGHNVKDYIDEQSNIVQNSTTALRNNASSMSQCQNYYLQNESNKNTWNRANTAISAYEGKPLFATSFGGSTPSNIINNGSPATQITSNFEPEASYEYEEFFFMAELAKEKDGDANIIVPFVEENEKYFSGTKGCSGSIGRTNAYSEDLYICRGNTEVKAYNPQAINYDWTPEIEGEDYEGPGEVSSVADSLVQYKIPLCITTAPGVYSYTAKNTTTKKCDDTYAAVYEFNYLTRSLQNSSFYVNRGHWYVDSVNDVKGHGDSAAAAVDNNEAGMKLLTSDLFGAKYNTFPIGLNTPRNIYQYSYAFKGIGIYPNNTDTSRIMGDEVRSMIKENVRKCFYEVFEDLCKCCGDPIVIYTHSTSKIGDTKDKLNSMGHTFDPSKDDYTNRTSNFGPKASSVSLFDINGVGDRGLGDNWSSSDPYFFVGKLYYTSKGAELLQGITAKGDTIYNNIGDLTPEYSYTLTPSVLAQIRGDNVPYGYTSDSLHVIDKVCFDRGTCDINSTDHGFYHFGSKYLENFLSSSETSGFTSIINGTTGASCLVTNASGTFSRGCRFIDYKTSSGHYLAFK